MQIAIHNQLKEDPSKLVASLSVTDENPCAGFMTLGPKGAFPFLVPFHQKTKGLHCRMIVKRGLSCYNL